MNYKGKVNILDIDIKHEEQFDLKIYLDEVLKSLSVEHAQILTYLFIEGMSLREVGKKYGRGKDAIRNIRDKAFRKLRHPCRNKY